MLAGGFQRQHGVVVKAWFLDVRKVRDEQKEVHGASPKIGLFSGWKASRTEFGHAVRVTKRIYLPSLAKVKVLRRKGQLSLSGMAAPLLRLYVRHHPHGALFYSKSASGTSHEC
jgi:hypothetical protein